MTWSWTNYDIGIGSFCTSKTVESKILTVADGLSHWAKSFMAYKFMAARLSIL